jgi:Fe-S-cluster containining protein
MSTDVSKFLDGLSEIFTAIDAEYEKARAHYEGFSCDGCVDNCCTTVFHHHTLIEYFYFIEGLGKLDPKLLDIAAARSEGYLSAMRKQLGNLNAARIMCPLNFEGQCRIYEHRPLICRIHGMPGVLHSVRGKNEWQGCKVFNEKFAGRMDHVIDRTMFYTKIAALEGDLREELQFVQKYKKTIADMILDYKKEIAED